MATNGLRLLKKRQIFPPALPSNCVRSIHATCLVAAPFRQRRVQDALPASEAMEMMKTKYKDDDTTSSGHLMLRQQRQILHYLRLIEHDMPRLVAFRKPFIQPDASTPLIVRSVHYAGEEHPVTVKRVVVVPVNQLPLRNAAAIHKIKLLAGSRWTPNPPADAGVSGLEAWEHGFIKISCERFPEAAMNLKWASDVLDRLVAEANDGSDTFKKVPVDLRHVFAKIRKAKKGDHLRGRALTRPSIRDFPKEWLPEPKPMLAGSTLAEL